MADAARPAGARASLVIVAVADEAAPEATQALGENGSIVLLVLGAVGIEGQLLRVDHIERGPLARGR